MKKSSIATAALLVAGMVSWASAAETKTATPAATAKPAAGAKPAASPGWVVIEEDWWFPHRYSFLDSLHKAGVHYRAKEEKAAAAEIDKAIPWLKYAANHADKTTQEDLMTAHADLMDFSAQLKTGKPVIAKKLHAAFANASAALAKHHHFKASAALAQSDLKTAGDHLTTAVDHLRAASRSANREYGDEIVAIYDTYAPYGYWDETIVYDKNKLAANLTTVQTELTKLAAELKVRH